MVGCGFLQTGYHCVDQTSLELCDPFASASGYLDSKYAAPRPADLRRKKSIILSSSVTCAFLNWAKVSSTLWSSCNWFLVPLQS